MGCTFAGKKAMGKIRSGALPLSRTAGMAHIENYYRSGLRPFEYYQSHGLTECQFYGWRKRYLALHPEAENKHTVSKSKKRFQPVKIESRTENQLSGLEIHYPNGVRVIVGSQQGIGIEKLKALIQIDM
jgi:hypothetical protein